MRIIRTFLTTVALGGLLLVASPPAMSYTSSVPEPRATAVPDAVGEATAALEKLKSRFRHLEGVAVSFARTPHGEQAVAYYSQGRIVIDPGHTTDVGTILDHEVWHIIDWRDNGRLDWGERVPPRDAAAYLKVAEGSRD